MGNLPTKSFFETNKRWVGEGNYEYEEEEIDYNQGDCSINHGQWQRTGNSRPTPAQALREAAREQAAREEAQQAACDTNSASGTQSESSSGTNITSATASTTSDQSAQQSTNPTNSASSMPAESSSGGGSSSSSSSSSSQSSSTTGKTGKDQEDQTSYSNDVVSTNSASLPTSSSNAVSSISGATTSSLSSASSNSISSSASSTSSSNAVVQTNVTEPDTILNQIMELCLAGAHMAAATMAYNAQSVDTLGDCKTCTNHYSTLAGENTNLDYHLHQ